jgi:hypothetical protein
MIQFICFSKDRPLQLRGYLESFVRHVTRPDLTTMVVIARSSTVAYQNAYNEIASEFPNVKFVWETNFHEDLINSIGPSELICFGCDDVVFFNKVDIDQVIKEFNDDTFAFSFRLGMNVNKSMFSGDMQYPEFISSNPVLAWNMHTSHHCADWGYSWELNGTVYPTDIAKKVIEEVKANSPNILENSGGGKWSKMTKRYLMKSFPQSKLAVPTVNVVQTNFANPICGKKELSSQFLLECWNNGLRMNIEPFQQQLNNSVHISSFFLRRV